MLKYIYDYSCDCVRADVGRHFRTLRPMARSTVVRREYHQQLRPHPLGLGGGSEWSQLTASTDSPN
jgi:hypothetical protein